MYTVLCALRAASSAILCSLCNPSSLCTHARHSFLCAGALSSAPNPAATRSVVPRISVFVIIVIQVVMIAFEIHAVRQPVGAFHVIDLFERQVSTMTWWAEARRRQMHESTGAQAFGQSIGVVVVIGAAAVPVDEARNGRFFVLSFGSIALQLYVGNLRMRSPALKIDAMTGFVISVALDALLIHGEISVRVAWHISMQLLHLFHQAINMMCVRR